MQYNFGNEPSDIKLLLPHIPSINFDFHINGLHDQIDELVDQEVQRIQEKCLGEEEHYVEQMLQQHPVIIDRRAQPQRSSSSDETTNSRDQIAQQRAESCRRSRINNKIKQTKTKFRHKYISNKLSQSVANLDCLREIIAQTESQLLLSGCDQAMLQNLRDAFGVNKKTFGENL